MEEASYELERFGWVGQHSVRGGRGGSQTLLGSSLVLFCSSCVLCSLIGGCSSLRALDQLLQLF
jgi:hypothetical protein